MRAVIQRVLKASVSVKGQTISEIKRGVLVFLGICRDDTEEDVTYLIHKTVNLRVFQDDQGKMNNSLLDVQGAALVVSQFTLFGDCRKGRRPSFSRAALPNTAQVYYNTFIEGLQQQGIVVGCGAFQEMMDVSLINDGPVTFLLDSARLF